MTVHMQREIEKLKKRVNHMVSLVEESLQKAIKALMEMDLAKAREVIAMDDRIDEAELEVEEECLKILALYQPVAIDLRYIIAMLKVNNDLERIGDLSVNIAEITEDLVKLPKVHPNLDYPRMAEMAQSMVRTSLQALFQMDKSLAEKVLAMDDAIDDMHREAYRNLAEQIQKEPQKTVIYIKYLSGARYLERIGDHATNIAEDVIYLLEGKIIRHRW